MAEKPGGWWFFKAGRGSGERRLKVKKTVVREAQLLEKSNDARAVSGVGGTGKVALVPR